MSAELAQKMDKLETQEMTPELQEQFKQWKEQIDELVQIATFQKDPVVTKIAEAIRAQIKAINLYLMEGYIITEKDRLPLSLADRDRLTDRRATFRWVMTWLVGAEKELEEYGKTIDEAIEEPNKK